MSLANPFGLLLLLLIPLIVLLHSLVLRRKKVRVSSLLLWQRLMRENPRSFRLRKTLRNICLLLQVLAAGLLALAVAQPFTVRPAADDNLILVLDASASMKTRSPGGLRYDEARAAALRALDRLGEQAAALLIQARCRPVLLSPFSSDREQLKRLVRDSRATDEPGDLEAALLLALSLADRSRGDRILLITDGAFDPPRGFDLQGAGLTVSTVGVAAENVGITQLRFSRLPETADQYQVLISLENFGTRRAERALRLELDGAAVWRETLTLAPGGQRRLIVPYRGLLAATATARLEEEDDLPADDRAGTVLTGSPRIRVLLFSPGNPFLSTVLDSLETVESEISGELRSFEGYDIVIFDRFQPPPLERGSYLFIDALPPNIGLRSLGLVRYPRVSSWEREHPLGESLDLREVVIAEARRSEVLDRDIRALVRSDALPLLLARDSGGLRFLYLPFDLFDSDLPLRVAFPVLMANALQWLSSGSLAADTRQIRSGDSYPIRLATAEGRSTVLVRRPDGSSETLEAAGEAALYENTGEVGFYTVASPRPEQLFAVNLLDRRESDVNAGLRSPAVETAAAAAADTDPEPGPPGQGLRPQGRVRLPLWPLLALLCLSLLLAEQVFWLRQR